MGDHFYGNISFPKNMVTPVIQEIINRDKLVLDGDENGIVTYSDGQAHNGRFDELEAALMENKIPFDRYSEGYCDISPERRHYRPAMGENPMVNTVVFLHRDVGEFLSASLIRSFLNFPAREFKDKIIKLYKNFCFPVDSLEEWPARTAVNAGEGLE